MGINNDTEPTSFPAENERHASNGNGKPLSMDELNALFDEAVAEVTSGQWKPDAEMEDLLASPEMQNIMDALGALFGGSSKVDPSLGLSQSVEKTEMEVARVLPDEPKNMTKTEMVQETMAHWLTYHRATLNKIPKEERLKQAEACADLTRMEMDSLKAVGLDEATAWVEARNLFCLTRPPKYDPQQMD